MNKFDWIQKRIKAIIDFYGPDFFQHKTILDLGCGSGETAGAFHRLGSDLTCVDARQDFLKIVSKKYSNIKTVKADLDFNYPFFGKNFDLILNLDFICHLRDYSDHLNAVCQSTTHLVLETAVCDSNDSFKTFPIQESCSNIDLAFNGQGNLPSSAAVERILSECNMVWKRIDSNKYNSGSYVYDWMDQYNNTVDSYKRRLWFAIKSNNTNQSIIRDNFSNTPVEIKGYMPVLKDSNIPVKQGSKLITSRKSLNISQKVAVCISGHLRTFESNFQSFKDNILSKYNCDVFIHTWDLMGSSFRFTDNKLHLVDTNKFLEKINTFYNPKKIVIEPYRTLELTKLMIQRAIPGRDAAGTVSMYYKIEACNNLKKEYEIQNNITYNAVIRFRSDLYLDYPLPLNINTDLSLLHIPLHGNFGGINDQLAFGNSTIMDNYSSVYSNMENLLNAGANLNPEKLLQAQINYHNLPVIKDYIKYSIRRANGMVQDNMLLEKALGFIK